MFKSLSIFILFFLIAATAFAQQPQIDVKIIQDKQYIRLDNNSVCQGELVQLNANFTKDNIRQFNWKINGRNYYNLQSYTLSTNDLLGSIEILSEVIYVDKKYRMVGKKRELCEVTCHAYSQILLNVIPCRKTCPQIPIISLTSDESEYSDRPIHIYASLRTDGVKSKIKWRSTSGKFVEKSENTILFYPDVNTVESIIYADVETEYPECFASDRIVLYRKSYPILPIVETAACNLKTNRVDNKCKANLTELLRKFQSNDGRSITILYSNLEKAENARKVLTTGELGVKLDSFKINLEYRKDYDLVFLIKY